MAKLLKEAQPVSSPAGKHADTAGEFQTTLVPAAGAACSLELIDFLLHNKKWWLTPIILALLASGRWCCLQGRGRRRLSTRCSKSECVVSARSTVGRSAASLPATNSRET